MTQTVKNPSAMQKTWDRSPGWEDPLEEGMATHSNVFAWRIPRDIGDPGLILGLGRSLEKV